MMPPVRVKSTYWQPTAFFVDGAVERLKGSGLFKSLRCTNTHVNACRFAADDFVKVYDITPVLAAGLEISN